ncbi:P-type conjugative transfer protein TrbJ [Nitratidesulfovibrio liaohensis]|uniref:P-type conjugative transfer protein TrbJ n=1 Tax=Nitratidesulfovibrio liaohensis TaxID=2604158 RepID=A0ABY9R3M8_9BACT|nr:P-type conjugative transfer protein TrbJ [Nitratidesulfovibrio liaohensis]WMW66366.1 P-type conjugative transfer protein TrbJ [Nitratidesulfovibrio liaohensis]
MIKSSRVLVVVLTAMVTVFCSPSEGKTVYCSNCSTKFVQALDRVTNVSQLSTMMSQLDNDVAQTAHQLRMVQQNVEQYENMMKNTKNLDPSVLSEMQGEFRRMGNLIRELDTRKAEADAAARKYQEMYPDQAAIGGMGQGEYQQQWDSWAAENDRAAQATYQMSSKQLGDLQDADEYDARVQELLNTPEGRMEAIQAGNQLSAMALQESRSLRALLATQAQQQAQAAAMEQKEKQAQEEHDRKLRKRTDLLGVRTAPLP